MKELLLSVTLKDCDVQTKRGSGKGGQNRNFRVTSGHASGSYSQRSLV